MNEFETKIDEFNTLLFATIFHIKRKKERKKETKQRQIE
jgi:hypothetical protein